MDLVFNFPWEASLITWLQSHLPDYVIQIISSFSAFGEVVCAVLILGFFYWGYDKEYGKKLGLTVLSIAVVTPLIKNVVLRNRPYVDHKEIKLYRLIDGEADAMNIAAQGYSFPSGHSSNSFVIYGSLAQRADRKWLKALLMVIPFLVGVSRVTVGAHYPTDVLGGWLLSLIMMMILEKVDQVGEKKNMFLAGIILLCMTGIFFCKSADYFSALGVLIGFVGGTVFEDKKVRFEKASTIKSCLLRLAGGLIIFGVLNVILKLPFSIEFLESGSSLSFLYRTFRYAVIAFIDMGLYPMLFRHKIFR